MFFSEIHFNLDHSYGGVHVRVTEKVCQVWQSPRVIGVWGQVKSTREFKLMSRPGGRRWSCWKNKRKKKMLTIGRRTWGRPCPSLTRTSVTVVTDIGLIILVTQDVIVRDYDEALSVSAQAAGPPFTWNAPCGSVYRYRALSPEEHS